MKSTYSFPLKSIVTTTAIFAATAALLLCQCEVNVNTGNGNGNGDDNNNVVHQPDTAWYADNPDAAIFEISTADDLAGLALLVNNEESPVDFAGKTVKLAADIDLSTHYGKSYNDRDGWIAIGYLSSDRKTSLPFKGVFDGNGKVISGLYISGNKFYTFKGLFGRIEGGAVIKNLGLIDVNISGGTGLGGVVGSAAGNSKVVNCYAKGVVNGNSSLGGIAGEIEKSEVSGCYFNGSVISNTPTGGEIGGVVGSVKDGSVVNCYALGDKVSGVQEVGGVVGSADAVKETNLTGCYSAVSSVVSSSGGVGGILGYAYNNTLVTYCAALNKSVKDTDGGTCVGRIVGCFESDSDITLSDNTAFSGMEGGAWDNKGAADLDGADIAKEAIKLDGTLGGLFKTSEGWTIQNGMLPGLGGSAVDMPEHLR
jgi:hypothetical protein